MWQAEERAARLATVEFQGSRVLSRQVQTLQGTLLKTRYAAKDTGRHYDDKRTFFPDTKKLVTVSRNGNELNMQWKRGLGEMINNTYKVLRWDSNDKGGEVVLDPNVQLVDTKEVRYPHWQKAEHWHEAEVIGCAQKTNDGKCEIKEKYTTNTRGFNGIEGEEAFFTHFRIMALASALCDINETFDTENSTLIKNELSEARIQKLDFGNNSKYMSQIIQLLYVDKKSIENALLPVEEFRLIGTQQNTESFLAIVKQGALRNLKTLNLSSPIETEAAEKLAATLDEYSDRLVKEKLFVWSDKLKREVKVDFKDDPIYSLTTINIIEDTESKWVEMLLESMKKLNESRRSRNRGQFYEFYEEPTFGIDINDPVGRRPLS